MNKTSHLELLAKGLKKVNPNNFLLGHIRNKYREINAPKPTSKPPINENVVARELNLSVDNSQKVDP
jgi:hypothetical protein